MSSSNPEAPKVNNILFMGPLTHREQSVEAFKHSKLTARWSEDVENEYLENVKQRATEKVRALLLQAKRRSDEIIREAEEQAQQIKNNAEQEASQIIEAANIKFVETEKRFQNIFNEAMDKAQTEIQHIIMNSQKDLGESTAIVLLSIHEQLAKFYDAWKEDLKQLTIEAIQVGTSWILTTEKKEILNQMLEDSIYKLIERKNFIVRVNPADSELVKQVLENSRTQSWRVEATNDLEPGSLELESDNVFIKNSSYERQKFVHEILSNLIIPKTDDDAIFLQKVTDTVTKEMNTNPLLAQSYHEAEEETHNETSSIDLPNIPEEQLSTESEIPKEEEQIENAYSSADIQNETDDIDNAEPHNMIDVSDENEDSDEQDNEEEANEIINDNPEQHYKPIINNHLGQPIREPITPAITLPEEAHEEAQDMVEQFLGELEEKENHLPTNVADDLLAEMGFEEKK